MVATEFFGYVQSFSACNYVGFEDLADRANFQWNVIILLICMLLVTLRQYFMTPLVCYLPTTVSGVNADSYITNLCWIEGTFPINLTSGVVPHRGTDWDALRPHQMNYYQWVPLVLGLQAILYYIPRVCWSIFTYNRTGTDLQNLVRTANSIAKEDGEKRQKMVHHIARTLELLLFNRREYRGSAGGMGANLRRQTTFLPSKRHGNKLVYVYLFVKILYAIVGACQLYMMYVFLRFDSREGYMFFGFRILSDIINGKPWTETQVFPRVGMCRHTLQHVGASNRLFAQCVLPINMLNEKIYVFLFFFLGAVMCITLISIPLWIIRMGLKKRQRHFVRRFLKIADVYDRDDPKMVLLVDRFIKEFLRQDGHFILRMISMNAGDLVTVEIVCCLFADYKKQYADKDFRGPPILPKTPKYSHMVGYLPGNHVSQGDTSVDIADKGHGGFMSAKLEQGDGGTLRQRPLPSAPYPLINHSPAVITKAHKEIDSPEVYPVSMLRSASTGAKQPDGQITKVSEQPTHNRKSNQQVTEPDMDQDSSVKKLIYLPPSEV
ncbi:unnamed protein product [Calicophoron daubneyi]|uniref:Innexin n=1 Tax=Calicophoron daubneyi TaxID=300641 RepID=A0AAV2TG22_CALDB